MLTNSRDIIRRLEAALSKDSKKPTAHRAILSPTIFVILAVILLGFALISFSTFDLELSVDSVHFELHSSH